MKSLFDQPSDCPTIPPVAVNQNVRPVQNALALLKDFRAGRIEPPAADISRALDVVFQFVEQVTT